MQISYSKTREQFPLSYKKIIKKTIADIILLIIIFLIIFPFLFFIFWKPFVLMLGINNQAIINWPESIAFGLFISLIILILLAFLYEYWYFVVYFYDLTPDFIQIRKGPIMPREITIPYERIQDVYVDQDILDRIFGLYDVHVSSATISSGTEAHIDGVEKRAAEGLRDLILKTVKQKISKNKDQGIFLDNNPINSNL